MKMKKIFTFLLAVLFTHAAFSQDLWIGGKGSFTLSNMTGLDTYKPNSVSEGGLSAPGGGLFMNYRFKENWSISFDIANVIRGAKFYYIDSIGGGSFISENYTQRFRSFEFPLAVNYHIFKTDSKMDPYVGIGLYGLAHHYTKQDIEYVSSIKTADGFETTTTNVSIDNTTFFNKIDYGMVAGAGFAYKVTDKIKVGIDARYYLGLIDSRENIVVYKDQTLTPPSAIRHNALNLSLSVFYNLTAPKAAKEAEKAK